MSKKLGLDKQYKNLNVNRNYLQFPVINSVKPKPTKPAKMNTGGLSGGQKKIAAKAPPYDKIGGNDFAVLRKEKGRGEGLQDEKMKPGKVMKANKGLHAEKKKNENDMSKLPKGLRKDTTTGFGKNIKKIKDD